MRLVGTSYNIQRTSSVIELRPLIRQLLSPPLVFDIITPGANLVTQKSKLPQDPERLPLRMLEKTIALAHQEELFLYCPERLITSAEAVVFDGSQA